MQPAEPDVRKVRSFDGTEIYYDFYPSPSRRVVLVVPGFWRTRRWPTMAELARRVLDREAAAAVLDLRGHGDSGGTFGFNRHEHHDLAAVVRDLLARDRVERIDVIALSLGASIAVTAAARFPELPWGSFLLISPVARFRTILPLANPFTLHRHLALSQAFRAPRFDLGFWFRAKLDAADEIVRARVPLTIVHCRRDWLVHHRHGHLLWRLAAEPKQLHILPVRGRFHADRLFTAAPDAIDPILEHFLTQRERPRGERGLSEAGQARSITQSETEE